MEKRRIILEVLQKVRNRLEQLEEVIQKTPNHELENILEDHFREFGINIEANFDFMEKIVTRMEYSDTAKMSNEELENYFEEHWDVLIFP